MGLMLTLPDPIPLWLTVGPACRAALGSVGGGEARGEGGRLPRPPRRFRPRGFVANAGVGVVGGEGEGGAELSLEAYLLERQQEKCNLLGYLNIQVG